jgi:hypothetical protein
VGLGGLGGAKRAGDKRGFDIVFLTTGTITKQKVHEIKKFQGSSGN